MFEIEWTEKAEHLYLEALEFWINHNKSATYSKKIVKQVSEKEDYIANNPYAGQEVFDIPGVRYVVVLRKFLIFYRINNKTIQILSFWDGHKNPQDLEL